VVSLIEVPSQHQRDAHCLKVLWADGFIVEPHVFIAGGRVAADRHIRERDATQRQRQASRQSCGLHAWQRSDALDRVAIKLAPASLIVAPQERIEGSEQNVIRIKSRIRLVRFSKTADEQPGANQGDHREGELSNHQPVPQRNPVLSASDQRVFSFRAVAKSGLEA
jgi:hypothetical protein